jgi:hypothetical protein
MWSTYQVFRVQLFARAKQISDLLDRFSCNVIQMVFNEENCEANLVFPYIMTSVVASVIH